MALVGSMISTSGWNQIPRQGGNAAEVNYAMFLSVWTLFSMLVFVPVALDYGHFDELLVAALAFDGLSLLFYMCGGIALAAAMNVHSCSNTKYTMSNRITNSSPNTAWRCREAQATTAFVWFTFTAFIVSTAFTLMAVVNKTQSGDRPRTTPNAPSGGPPVALGIHHIAGAGQEPGAGTHPMADISDESKEIELDTIPAPAVAEI
jgi:hypothetical protein